MTKMFEDEDKIDELEKYNRKRALTNILEGEEHMSLEGTGDESCPHPWCARKHAILVSGHMREAVEHADEERKDIYRDIKSQVDDWLNNNGNIDELRELRNYMRGKFKDTSLGVECDDGVCHYDIEGIEGSDNTIKKENVVDDTAEVYDSGDDSYDDTEEKSIERGREFIKDLFEEIPTVEREIS